MALPLPAPTVLPIAAPTREQTRKPKATPAADPGSSGAMGTGVAIDLGCAAVLNIAVLVAYKLLLLRRAKQSRNTFTDGGIVLSPWKTENAYAPPAQEDALGGGPDL